MNAPSRPLLRWHGGKWKLAPWIISHFGEHRCYVEPFGGGASVLLRKPRSHAEVYNDLDGEAVNLFNVARERGEELTRVLRLTPFARAEFREAYEASDDPLERARRLLIRSFMGFGSNGHERLTGFRSNSSRSGTTPARDWHNYPEVLPVIIERLQGVVIENRDAVKVMADHDGPATLHFLDPPYLPETRDRGADYAHEMTVEDHCRLLRCVRGLHGMVILSGYPSEIYDSELGGGWSRVARKALADGARSRVEALWLNAAAAAACPQGRLL